jgi:hypothetical protein
VNEEDGIALVDAGFGASPIELASLLRTVETWVETQSLRAIRYELDGRCYVMEAGDADWSAVPRPAVPDRI